MKPKTNTQNENQIHSAHEVLRAAQVSEVGAKAGAMLLADCLRRVSVFNGAIAR